MEGILDVDSIENIHQNILVDNDTVIRQKDMIIRVGLGFFIFIFKFLSGLFVQLVEINFSCANVKRDHRARDNYKECLIIKLLIEALELRY